MVYIREGREDKIKSLGTVLKGKMYYYEDTVWSTRLEARKRASQLESAGDFTIIDQKKFTNAPDEYVVWRSKSKRKGTRNAKKRDKAQRHRDMVEGK